MPGHAFQLNPLGAKFWLGVCAGALGAYLALGVFAPQARQRGAAVQAKQNLHSVQLALERFAVDNDGGEYPSNINDLIRSGYLAQFPPNPFADRPMRGTSIDLPARGEDGWLTGPELPVLPPGDFVYVRRYGEGYIPGQPPGALSVTGYTLVLY